MKIRPLLLSVFLVAAFVWFTTTRWSPVQIGFRSPAKLWTEAQTAQSAGLTAEENSNIAIYRASSPATVNITSTVYQRDWFFQVYPVRESGSGFIVDTEGRILTNYHVVSGTAPAVEVTLEDKTKHKARVLVSDRRNDMALIKIEPRGKLPVLRLGDSEHLQVGQKVLAIGNPFGLEGTLTTGVISSLGRTIQDENGMRLEDMIQTDAAINPGNSGGPLLNSTGDVIGINTAIYGPGGNIGIGFAIPINRAKTLLSDYTSRGRTMRPYLGITTNFLTPDLAEALGLPAQPGLLIASIEPGSPADQAGLRGADREVAIGNYLVAIGGDYVVAVDGQAITSRLSLSRAMERKKAGDALRLTIIRGRRRMDVNLTLGESPQRL
jgi:S1-C subfamily serine protease